MVKSGLMDSLDHFCKSLKEKKINRAPRLSKEQDEYWRSISIVADLTMKQRKMEQAMFKKAEELNLARSREDQAKNLVHKVLGRRGERVLRQVELRLGESVSQEGKVVMAGMGDRQERRGDWP